jgi:hypothetical protein
VERSRSDRLLRVFERGRLRRALLNHRRATSSD